MAATRKSAKRSAKESPGAKRKSAGKKSTRKRSSKRAVKTSGAPKAAQLKRRARKGLKAARGGVATVLRAGGKTWKTLKSTTAQVVEGVKETLAGERR